MTTDDVDDDLFDVEVRPGKIMVLMRTDVLTLFLSGSLPSSLQAAVDKVHTMQRGIVSGHDVTMSKEDQDELLTMLRAYAVQVVVQPPLTLDKNLEPHKADVHKLSAPELLNIFNAIPPDDGRKSILARRLTGGEAISFRPGILQPDDETAPTGPDLPGASIVVSDGERTVEFISV